MSHGRRERASEGICSVVQRPVQRFMFFPGTAQFVDRVGVWRVLEVKMGKENTELL